MIVSIPQNSCDNWPESDLEHLGKCPLCASPDRTVIYVGLRDRVFRSASGQWTLHKCASCACLYLDPRPIQSAIGRAYTKYFTHDETKQSRSVGILGRVKQLAFNSYLNVQWGMSLAPAFRALGFLLPSAYKAYIDCEVMRNIPRPFGGGRLLDVGCGSGKFLLYAKSLGWSVSGFDSDPKAVESARQSGLDVKLGGMETLLGYSGLFDVITVSHVIEHVYNPQKMLHDCFRLLRPGGYFWIETPNIESYGHLEFKENWLDLDPPRHLTLYTFQGLMGLLSDAGFCGITPLGWRPEYEFRRHASMALRKGKDPMRARATIVDRIVGHIREVKNRRDYLTREFVTLKATKG